MAFEDEVELINEYNAWVTQRKLLATDVTPEAFLKDRMKEDAGERVIRAIDFIEKNLGGFTTDGVYKKHDPQTRHVPFHEIEKILRGTV